MPLLLRTIQVRGSLDSLDSVTPFVLDMASKADLPLPSLLDSVGYEATPVDTVVERSQLPVDVVLERLVEMELEGIVEEATRSFAYRNVNMEDLGITKESMAEKYRDVAFNQVKRHLLLGKMIESEKA